MSPRSFHVDGPKTKGAGTNSGESGTRNLADNIRSGAKSTGGRVKLKTVIEIRRSSASDTFIAETVYLVLNSLLNWNPVQKLKQRCDVVSFTFLHTHTHTRARARAHTQRERERSTDL